MLLLLLKAFISTILEEQNTEGETEERGLGYHVTLYPLGTLIPLNVSLLGGYENGFAMLALTDERQHHI